jgi:hypothetical protein
MGGMPSCKCNKTTEAEELDLEKEKMDSEKKYKEMQQEEHNLNFGSSEKEGSYENAKSGNRVIHQKQSSLDMGIDIYDDNIFNGKIQIVEDTVNLSSIKNLPSAQTNAMLISKRFQNYKKGLNNAPLEVINEITNDMSRTSQYDTKSITTLKNSPYMSGKNNELMNYKTNLNQNEISMMSKSGYVSNSVYNGGHPNNGGISQFNSINSHNNILNYSTVKEVEESHENTIPNKEIESKKRKERFNISNIISEQKLLNCSDGIILLTIHFIEEIIFQSELKKLINYSIKVYSTQMYSSRFCVITKNEFRYYKSKEQLLTMQKPLMTIPFFQIKEVDFFHMDSNKKNGASNGGSNKKDDHFYISLLGSPLKMNESSKL